MFNFFNQWKFLSNAILQFTLSWTNLKQSSLIIFKFYTSLLGKNSSIKKGASPFFFPLSDIKGAKNQRQLSHGSDRRHRGEDGCTRMIQIPLWNDDKPGMSNFCAWHFGASGWESRSRGIVFRIYEMGRSTFDGEILGIRTSEGQLKSGEIQLLSTSVCSSGFFFAESKEHIYVEYKAHPLKKEWKRKEKATLREAQQKLSKAGKKAA